MTDAPAAFPPAAFPPGVALVVGGSGGVGAAIALGLARAGADVALTFRRGRDAAEATAAAARALGRRGEVHPLDLADPEAPAALAAALAAAHGRLHTVVHAAGADIPQVHVADVTPEAWLDAVTVEQHGFFHLVRGALPFLRAAGGASLLAVTSAGLYRHPPGDVLSVAPKAAVEALVRAVAREEGRHGVRANAVALGVIDAGHFHRARARGDFSPAWLDAARRNTPLRRFGTADEVAAAAVFLCSAGAGFVTGQTLRVDGGYSV